MNTKWLSLILLMMSSHSWAQAGALFNAEVSENTSVTNPAKVMKSVEGQWLAFSAHLSRLPHMGLLFFVLHTDDHHILYREEIRKATITLFVP